MQVVHVIFLKVEGAEDILIGSVGREQDLEGSCNTCMEIV